MSRGVDPRRVVVTGAAGAIGSVVVAGLRDRWRIHAVDIRDDPGIDRLDICDLERCRTVFTGADAVVHLAADPDPEADWEALRAPNLEGAYAVCAAVRAAGVRRLVLASSLQAVRGYPVARQRRAADAPRPGSLYGATKAWSEALGSWVAETSDTSVVALRIGFFAPGGPAGVEATDRNRSAWLSPGDAVSLMRAAVEVEREGFVVVHGTSANRFAYVDLDEAERAIGYRPVDDAFAGMG